MADTYPLDDSALTPIANDWRPQQMAEDIRAAVAALSQQAHSADERMDRIHGDLTSLIQMASHTRAEVQSLVREFQAMNGRLVETVQRVALMEGRRSDDSGSYSRLSTAIETLQRAHDERLAVERGKSEVWGMLKPWLERAAYLVGGIGLLLMLQHGADILTHVKVGP